MDSEFNDEEEEEDSVMFEMSGYKERRGKREKRKEEIEMMMGGRNFGKKMGWCLKCEGEREKENLNNDRICEKEKRRKRRGKG